VKDNLNIKKKKKKKKARQKIKNNTGRQFAGRSLAREDHAPTVGVR